MNNTSIEMSVEKAISFLLKLVAAEIQKEEITLVDLIAYESSRPFNMKGQEFEEIIGFMLNREIIKIDKNASIKMQSNKKAKDLIFNYSGQEFPFSIKNYTIDRFQISTYAKDLDYFKQTYVPNLKSEEQLDEERKLKLILDLREKLDSGITLFALTDQPKDLENKVDIYLRTLNRENFLSNIDKIIFHQTKGKTSHSKFWFYKKCGKLMLEVSDPIFSLDLGQNPLNRGLWFTYGKKHFKNFEANKFILDDILSEVLTKKQEDMSVWNAIDDNERVEYFLKFLKLQKEKS